VHYGKCFERSRSSLECWFVDTLFTLISLDTNISSTAEIDSICLTMVSAGLDTIPGNLILGLAFLSSPAGQAIQQKAYDAIKEVYPDNDAWTKCLDEEKVPYIVAFYKEVLRYWTVIPICLPRVSIKDIPYEGTVIPAGTTFYMNAYAADYDSTHFKDPYTFMPERYLDQESSGVSHYAYGAGSRMCAGSHLANRELYVAFVRLISAFEIMPSKLEKDRPIMDSLEANAIPTSLTVEPKAFKCGFKVRDAKLLEKWIGESEVATKDL
jgi:phenylacetate 2-hydroxylase